MAVETGTTILYPCWVILQVLTLLIITSSYIISAQLFDYPEAKISTTWNNNPTIQHSVNFTDGSMVRSILLKGLGAKDPFGPRYACGFYCNSNCTSFLFAIFIVQTNSASLITSPSIGFPQVIWSANRNNPVKENSTLTLTIHGDLILRDSNGTKVWSTNTTGKSVTGLKMTEMGNLVLFDKNNITVWQSFDFPTDSLVLGQILTPGQRLTSGLFTLSVTAKGLFAFVGSDPSQTYYEKQINDPSRELSFVRFVNGSLSLFISASEIDSRVSVPLASSIQYMKLGSDGHLRVYEWLVGWKQVADLLNNEYLGDCSYPMVCGNYGICSNGQCSCPGIDDNETSYFRQLNDRLPNLGCSRVTPLACETLQYHKLLEMKDITYFNLFEGIANIDMVSCEQICLKNCSCKAALFQYGGNASDGNCVLLSQLFSFMNNDKEKTHYNSTAFIKVQVPPISSGRPSSPPSFPSPNRNNWNGRAIIVGSILGVFFFSVLLAISIWLVLYRKKKDSEEEDEDDYLDQVPGMPVRFSYEDLKAATEDFCRKLGEGGFGSVFEGTLSNGIKIAVKRLDRLGQQKKSFLAEVETIGSIHHVNLVKLIGFCSNKSHRLLVYEYMRNGSLDKWIFQRSHEPLLDWKTRKKVILDIAKGLAYLHEECRQKIVHLDIKPQNILLDENFNAKVSDFGLSKLINKDQSKVMTTMRGTLGYLAPEWLSSVITEKVDVYSFGVVVMEIICGRKNLDRSQPEERMHLLGLLKQKVEEDQLLDLVDKSSEDMQLHGEEAMGMMKVSAWCLHSDFSRRPSMSIVVKVLEGVMDVEPNLDYDFSTPPPTSATVAHRETVLSVSDPLLPSVLSGPR